MADRKHVESFADDLDGYFKVSLTYSGRGMYGTTCVSVTIGHNTYESTSLGDVFQAVFDIGMGLGSVDDPKDFDEARAYAYDSFLRSASVDGMGTGLVIYFPAANTTGWGKDDDEEED